MEKLSISEKMKAYIQSKGLQINEFEAIVGWPQGTVRKMTNSFKKDRFLTVSEKFPDFDLISFLDVPLSSVQQVVNDGTVGVIGSGTNITNNYKKSKESSEHDELISLRTKMESIKSVLETVEDDLMAVKAIAKMLGVKLEK